MEKGFFKFFGPKNSSKRLKIPTAYMDYKIGKLPRKVSLRDQFGNMWPIEVARVGKDSYFQYGWEKFVEENKVEYGDFLIFDYDGKGVFDFKHMGTTCCEKKRAGGLKLAANEEEKEEINDDHQMNVELEGKWLGDSSSSSSNSNDDYIVEEEAEEDEEYDGVKKKDEEAEEEENERATIICKKKDTRSKGKRVNDEQVEKEEDEVETEKRPHSKYRHMEEEKVTKKVPISKRKFMEEEDDEKEQEEENQRASVSTKERPGSKCRFVEEENDVEDEEYEKTEEEEEEEDNEKASILKDKAPRSKRRIAKDEEDDEEEECDEEEEENERAGIFKKKASCSKAGCKRVFVRKEKYYYDHYGIEIFKSGRATQPKNPYFVAKMRGKRRNQLYVPTAVVRDNKLKLPSSMTIRSAGKEYETKLKIWKDGRIWLHGGWHSLCRWNLVEKNDWCICEFVRGKGKKGLYLQVQVLHEGASSNSSKKNKK